MAIIRGAQCNKGFYVLSNTISNDERLSLPAYGLLIYLLSRPDNWNVQETHLRKRFNIGRDKCRKLLAELVMSGYATKQQARNPSGSWEKNDWIIQESPLTENPSTVNPLTDKPPTVNTSLNKNLSLPNTDNQQELIQTSCADAQPDAIPAYEVPLNTGPDYIVYHHELQEWQALYPAIDVYQELRSLIGWNQANPKKRKTKNGIKRHINSWLARAQDNGGNGYVASNRQPAVTPSAAVAEPYYQQIAAAAQGQATADGGADIGDVPAPLFPANGESGPH